MKVAVFSAKSYDHVFLAAANTQYRHELVFFETHLSRATAALARGFPAVCAFVNDHLDAAVLEALAEGGTRLVALRCAGFNNVDLKAAQARRITVVRVPAYSPYAVAEHTVALLLALNRKVHRAYNRVREGNFALDGLLGFDVHGLTVGIVGTGRIGVEVARIMNGFGCPLLAFDPKPNPAGEALGIRYVDLDRVFREADIITLHCPLTSRTRHMIDAAAIEKMKPGVMLINTGRGALIDTVAVIAGLKSGKIGYLGLDVYEEEDDLFYEDLSNTVLKDDVFARLLTFPNVIITGHQAFFTRNALENIAQTTLANIADIEHTGRCANQVVAKD
ncbi:MAG TPA: 2-hydroxyacid dehydrogenase [Burkholderiales bacterium]|nr:2-hydroxyacid dehydrogenase [Burkholderiales bacterium]